MKSGTLFVSPHLDDVALSCGGLVAKHAAVGLCPAIVTVFTEAPDPGEPLTLSARAFHRLSSVAADDMDEIARFWGRRREEDLVAARLLRAAPCWLGHRDVVYRRKEGATHDDGPLEGKIGDQIVSLWRETTNAVVYLPLGVGDHPDHHLIHRTGAVLRAVGASVRFYEDAPYVFRAGALERRLAALESALDAETIDVREFIGDRLAAVEAYASQVPSLSRWYGPLREEISRYATSLSKEPERSAERTWKHRDT